ncbi:MAG: hypothetical protein GX621_00885 [Pirellulaceae bacterium]|nr:hypothetical protein [Pirellulaceae bacterium]
MILGRMLFTDIGFHADRSGSQRLKDIDVFYGQLAPVKVFADVLPSASPHIGKPFWLTGQFIDRGCSSGTEAAEKSSKGHPAGGFCDGLAPRGRGVRTSEQK